MVTQCGYDLVGQWAVDPKLGQLAVEKGLVVYPRWALGPGPRRTGSARPCESGSRRRSRRSGSVIDEMCPCAGCPQAEDEPAGPGGQARLVRVPDHRRVEQGCRFQGVFLGEVGADQQARLSLIGRSVSRCFRTCSNRCRKNSRVRGCRSRNSRITFSNRHSTSHSGRDATRRDDLLDPVLARRLERPDDDAGVGRLEDDPGAL